MRIKLLRDTVMTLLKKWSAVVKTTSIKSEEGSAIKLRDLGQDTSHRLDKVALTFLRGFGQDLLSRAKSVAIRSLSECFKNFKANFPELMKHKERESFRWQMPLSIPPNTKFIDFYDGNTVIVIEERPRVRLARFNSDFCDSEYRESGYNGYWDENPIEGIDNQKTHFHLAFPYMIYVLEFRKDDRYPMMRVFYRKQPLNIDDDRLFLCHLPNIAPEGDSETEDDNKVCAANGYQPSDILATVCHEAILDYWSSEFSCDYSDNWCAMREQLGDVWGQEKKAEQDPKHVLGVDWQESDYTISTLLDQIYDGWEKVRVDRQMDKSCSVSLNDMRREAETAVTISLEALSSNVLTDDACTDKLWGFLDQFARALFRNAQNDFSTTKRHFSRQTIRQFTTALQTAMRRTVDELRPRDK